MRSSFVWVIAVAACGPSPAGGVDAPVGQIDGRVVDAPPIASGPVRIAITADNAYSFGYGTAQGITSFTQGTRALTAGQIFNCPVGEGPETYDIAEADAPAGAYLYIVTWDDLSVTQGVLGQFTRDTGTVRTGDAKFEVCATGINYATGPDALVGPSRGVIDAEIARCNAGSGDAATTSKGWVNTAGAITPGGLGTLAVGEANDAQTGVFPIVCQPTASTRGIDPESKWMWYQPAGVDDAFHSDGTNRFKAFLIFRLAAGDIIN